MRVCEGGGQYLKLRFEIMPWKTMHPTLKMCVQDKVISIFNVFKYAARTGCTYFESMHPNTQLCTPGTGCILNFKHCQGLSIYIHACIGIDIHIRTNVFML